MCLRDSAGLPPGLRELQGSDYVSVKLRLSAGAAWGLLPLTGARPHQAGFSLRMSFRGAARSFCHLSGKTHWEISLKKALNAGQFCS